MKAPSEKHLEDWIFNHPQDFINAKDKEYVVPFLENILGRQVQLFSGIADMVATDGATIYVVEIKKDAINSKTLAQVLRYMHDMRHIWREVWLNAHSVFSSEYGTGIPNAFAYQESGKLFPDEPEVMGLLVGYSVPDANIKIACEATDIHLVLYEYHGDEYPENQQYTFEYTSAHSVFDAHAQLNRLVYGDMGLHIREIVAWRTHCQQLQRELIERKKHE